MNNTFICLDCESTGLDTKQDRLIEIAICKFTFDEVIETYETLVDPTITIPEASIAIHHITQDMVQGKPIASKILPECIKLIGNHPIVGHGIGFDIDLIQEEAKRASIPCRIDKNQAIDTLRLARLYGQSPVNSLEHLRHHFNIPEEGAHRAMSDVIVNIEVFKRLSTTFPTLKKLTERLKKPIRMKQMPLGKHKGRKFSEIPIEYLKWAARQSFDQDLLFSIRSELSKRKNTTSFSIASNPFHLLDE